MNQVIDTTEIERQVELAVHDAADLVIKDDPGLESAGSFLVEIKTILKRIDETFNEPIKQANTTHKTILAAKKKHTEPLTRAERVIKAGITTYRSEQRVIQEQREQRLREQARRQEDERILLEASELEESGKPEEAEALIEQPVYLPPIVLPKETKVQGISTRTAWKWRLRNKSLLPPQYLTVDEKALNKVVAALGQQCDIPGIEVYAEEIVSARAG